MCRVFSEYIGRKLNGTAVSALSIDKVGLALVDFQPLIFADVYIDDNLLHVSVLGIIQDLYVFNEPIILPELEYFFWVSGFTEAAVIPCQRSNQIAFFLVNIML